jgi:allophanate hydrolase subunit 2
MKRKKTEWNQWEVVIAARHWSLHEEVEEEWNECWEVEMEANRVGYFSYLFI